jgi:hypothetical protein
MLAVLVTTYNQIRCERLWNKQTCLCFRIPNDTAGKCAYSTRVLVRCERSRQIVVARIAIDYFRGV